MGSRVHPNAKLQDIHGDHPIRMCAACRSRQEKTGFIRLARMASGRIVIDRSGKQGGRGVYLCPSLSCWQTALKRRSLERALRLSQLHPDDRVMLMQYIQELAEAAGHTVESLKQDQG